MGKLRGRFTPNSINSVSLNNGHSDTDGATAPLRGVTNGDGHPPVSIVPPTTTQPSYTSSTNGWAPRNMCHGPCKNHNDLNFYLTSDGMKEPNIEPMSDTDGEDATDDTSMKCGIGACKPKWIQPWANKKVFLAVFCLTSVLQGMYYTYFVSVLTTIEKLFQIQSKTTGIIMSATEMGQIGGALLLTYYGGQGHRPKWIACGMIVFAVASFLCSLPHFIFGAELSANVRMKGSMNRSVLNQMNLCSDDWRVTHHRLEETRNGETLVFHNVTSAEFLALTSLAPPISTTGHGGAFADSDFMFSNGSNVSERMPLYGDSDDYCEQIDSANHARITKIVLTIFFVSLLFIGIGATAVYTLGIPYIDDNVANRDSPLYFAITIGVRILGPVFGFLLGSFCTSLYVEPFETPIFNSKDPRWIGAWWLGLFIVAAALMASSFAMFAFPKQLPVKKRRSPCHPVSGNQQGDGVKPSLAPIKKPSLKEPSKDRAHHSVNGREKVAQERSRRFEGKNNFPVALRRLLKNDILLCRTASSVLHILPIAGLYTFLPKYIESQFRMTATEANMVSGMAGILVMGVGIFASGTFMRRYKPNPRFVAGWIAMTALAYAIGMVILTFVGCPLEDFASQPGVMPGIGQKIECNSNCNCNLGIFAPVCSSEGVTYYSACHAGCRTLNQTGITEMTEVFHNCTCLSPGITAKPGYCTLKCNNFVWYICIFSLFVLIHSTSEVGSMLLTLRCVDPKDKAMALGLISFAIGLFGNVPCPIIYGAVVDSACLVWETICGEQGACWLYDPQLFRKFFHGMTGAIMFLAFIVDMIVWYKAKDINFLDDEIQKVPEEAMPMNPIEHNMFVAEINTNANEHNVNAVETNVNTV